MNKAKIWIRIMFWSLFYIIIFGGSLIWFSYRITLLSINKNIFDAMAIIIIIFSIGYTLLKFTIPEDKDIREEINKFLGGRLP